MYTFGRWSLDVVGKAAIGVNNQYVRLYNLEIVDASNTGGGSPAVRPTTQEFSRNRFSAIPELTVTAGYQVTDHLKVTVGYDLLYWSAVVRAADQIAVEPTTGFPYGTLVGIYRCRRSPSTNRTSWPRACVWARVAASKSETSSLNTRKKGREPRGPLPFSLGGLTNVLET